jgi:hypothetical protein
MIVTIEEFKNYIEFNFSFLGFEFNCALEDTNSSIYRVKAGAAIVKTGFDSLESAKFYCLENEYEIYYPKDSGEGIK